jgi:hypothetical protein
MCDSGSVFSGKSVTVRYVMLPEAIVELPTPILRQPGMPKLMRILEYNVTL